MGIREPSTFRRQAVDIGGLNLGRTITPKVPITEIVGKDQDDVGRVVGAWGIRLSLFCHHCRGKGCGCEGNQAE